MVDRPRVPAALLFLGMAVASSPARAGDWPWWRGPEHTGISSETDLALEASEATSWSASVGLGYSCVSVSAGRLYTLGHDRKAGEDVVTCLDAATGKLLWTHRFPARLMDKAHEGGTLTTPSVDGDRVFVSNREGRFFCLAAADGKVLWSKRLDREFDVDLPEWGFAASPLVLDSAVIMNVGKVLALDKESGELLWESDDDHGDAYATLVPLEVGGEGWLAAFAAEGLVLLGGRDGSEKSSFPWKTRYDVNAATPVLCGEGRIFISSGYNHGCAMLRLQNGRLVSLWESKVMRNHMAGCVFHEGHLYGFDEGTFKCIDLDGNEKWAERRLGKGAHTLAGDRLVLLGEEGDLILAAASPDGYQELARSRVLEGGRCWTPPVVAHGRIYCRSSHGTLVCRDHRLPAGGEPPGR